MKKILSVILFGLALGASLEARADKQPKTLAEWDVNTASMRRTKAGDSLTVAYRLDLNTMKVPSEEAVLFTPVLVNGADSVCLNGIGVYGRNRYYHYLRRSVGMLSGSDDETVIRNQQRPKFYDDEQKLPYAPWMDGAKLVIRATCYGCCFTVLGQNEKECGMFVLPPTFRPAYVYTPAVTEIEDSLEGSAVIQFIVDRTEVRPDWRDNYRELSKITHSIDTIKADPDLTITMVWLKGFASPESPYKHNTDLARGRTQNLKEYVQQLYHFEPGIITTDYEPEDWAGLRAYVEASNIEHRTEILELIDRPMADLDKKEAEMKRLYPKDYAFLLEHAYPPLRHTEYKVKYKVRRFYDVEEIKRVMNVNPKKLTLNDFHLVAATYPAGSEDFNYVYYLAAKVYPDSPEANLNAANAALERGDYNEADRYLAKAGNRPEAQYAAALSLLLKERYEEALPGVQKAAADGVPGADEVLERLELYLKYKQ